MSDTTLYHRTHTGQIRVCNAKHGRCPYRAGAHMSLTLDELVAKRAAIAGKKATTDMGGVVPARARKPKVPLAYGMVTQPGETMRREEDVWRFTKADGSFREVDERGEYFYNCFDLRDRGDGPAVVEAGAREWWANGQRHNKNGPAVVKADGTMEWWLNGRRHRTGGPAIVWGSGGVGFWINGKRHNENGPAVVRPDGRMEWWGIGKHHRKGGPAVIHPDGRVEFWEHGKRVG